MSILNMKEVRNMKCSLGMLCEPLQALGLHTHKSARKVVRKSATKKRVVKKVAKKKSSKRR